jgi:hypothetical protein
MGASIKTDLRLCVVGGGRVPGAVIVVVGGAMLVGRCSKLPGSGLSKPVASIRAAPGPRPAWRCPRVETCDSVFLPARYTQASRGVARNDVGARLLRVYTGETVHFTCPAGGDLGPGTWGWGPTTRRRRRAGQRWPCETQWFREKTFESWRRPLVSLNNILVLVGRGLVSSGEGIARSGQANRHARRCHVLAGQARPLPGFDLFHFFPSGISGTRRSHHKPGEWSCRKRRRLARSRAQPFRTCSFREGPAGPDVWA